MAHPYQKYAGAYPSQNAYYYPQAASGNAHNQPMLYQPSEYLPGAGMLVSISSGMMAPAQEPAQAVTPRPQTRNPHYDPQAQQNHYQQAESSHTSTAAPVPAPVMPSFGYHPPHPGPQSIFQHSAFPAQPSQSLIIPSDYTYTIEPALVPLSTSASAGQSTPQRRGRVREPATRPARVGTLAPDSLLFQPFVPKFNQAAHAPQQPQPVDEVIEDDAWLQFLAQYPPTSLGF